MTVYDMIVVSDRARRKTDRYLDANSLRQIVREPPGDIYLNMDQNRYFLRVPSTDYPWTDALVVIVSLEGNDAVVVTQTSEHFDWDADEFNPVDFVGDLPGGSGIL